MRPVSLQIKGFTSFRDEQRVDFEGLDLFAIAGPTGSGKSSMLDAMTYALFGYVDRVGRQCSQLISQGQPVMSVLLEFESGDRRYRITRRTPVKGATKIQLEEWTGTDWHQPPGSDRVKEADAMIREAIGLDYEAFTRTVLLPQGRFAEFLVGDARERRSILTELLGLELFERLGKRAGEMKRQSAADANAVTTLIETQYAGITPDAVAEAETLAKAAAEREHAVADAEAKVRAVAERWAGSSRTIEELRTCERDLREAADSAEDVAGALDDVSARAAEIEGELKDRTRAVTAAERAAAKAVAAFEKAEASWGRTVELAVVRTKAESLLDARTTVEAAEAELEEPTTPSPISEAADEEADRAVAGGRRGLGDRGGRGGGGRARGRPPPRSRRGRSRRRSRRRRLPRVRREDREAPTGREAEEARGRAGRARPREEDAQTAQARSRRPSVPRAPPPPRSAPRRRRSRDPIRGSRRRARTPTDSRPSSRRRSAAGSRRTRSPRSTSAWTRSRSSRRPPTRRRPRSARRVRRSPRPNATGTRWAPSSRSPAADSRRSPRWDSSTARARWTTGCRGRPRRSPGRSPRPRSPRRRRASRGCSRPRGVARGGGGAARRGEREVVREAARHLEGFEEIAIDPRHRPSPT